MGCAARRGEDEASRTVVERQDRGDVEADVLQGRGPMLMWVWGGIANFHAQTGGARV